MKVRTVILLVLMPIALLFSGCSYSSRMSSEKNSTTNAKVQAEESKKDMIITFTNSEFNLNKSFDSSLLKNLSAKDLSILRNAIYAKYGYIFDAKEYSDYFSKFSWYKPADKNMTGKLNDVDKENIKEITALENNLSLQYKSSNLGFSLSFPESWRGKYAVREFDDSMAVYFKPEAAISDDKGRLFTVVKNPTEEAAGFYDDVKYIDLNGMKYLIGGPTDVTYTKEDPEYSTFARMRKEIQEVIKTIK